MPVTDIIQDLMIIKGLPPAQGDTNTAEQGMVSLNLMTSGQSGWTLDIEEGWNPIIPALKGGGVWADSAVSSGRQLLSNEEANVVETMRLIVTGTDVVDLARHFRAMGRMIQDARDFWATYWQIEPVYLRWFATGAPGPQFALIYNIEMAIEEPDTWSSEIRDVTITIEREPYWRPIPPGANPKLWSAITHGSAPLTTDADFELGAMNFNYANSTKHLFKDNNIDNRREWNTTQTGILSRNYVDIPGALIAGDAPALVCLAFNGSSNPLDDTLMIARQTKPTTIRGRTGVDRDSVLILNAGDNTTLGTDATVAADTGAPASNSQATGQRVAVSFATATAMTLRVSWSNGGETPLDVTLQRGLYAVFMRARISAASTVDLRLRYGQGTSVILNPTVRLTDAGVGGTGNTTEWAFLYMGTLRIPISDERASVNLNGKGLNVVSVSGSTTNLLIGIDAQRVGGAVNLYIADLFLMPFDEAALVFHNEGDVDISASSIIPVLDNTGYFMHGRPGLYSKIWATGGAEPDGDSNIGEVQGGDLTLLPGVDNRLHFMVYDRATMRADIATMSDMEVYINIVPRWRFIRDK